MCLFLPSLKLSNRIALQAGTGTGEKARDVGVVQHSTRRVYVKVTTSYVTQLSRTFMAAKAAGGRWWRGQFNIEDERKMVAAVILWRAQEIKVERQIYDEMRDGDVSSSRRQEVCERAVASIHLRL